MLQLTNLLLNSRVDSGVRMAEQVDPPGAHGVDVAVAFEVLKPDTFAPFDGHQGQGAFVVFHLGAGVPYGFEAAGDEVSVAHDKSPSNGGVLSGSNKRSTVNQCEYYS